MRILVLATTFPRWQGDSEPPFVYDLSRHLAEIGHEIVALVPHAAGAEKEEALHPPDSPEQRVRVIRFPYWPQAKGQRLCYRGGALPNLRHSWMARVNLPAFLWQQNRWIGRMLEHQAFDLIHSHWILPQGFFAVRHGAKKRIPVVLTAHAGDVFPMRKPVLRSLLRFTLRRSAAVTANSRATAEALKQLMPACEPEIIPMGVELARAEVDPPRSREIRERFSSEGPLILSVGRLAPKKGHRFLIQAMPTVIKQFPAAHLVLIGTGPMKKEIEQEIGRLNVDRNVSLPGDIPHSEMNDYYAAASCFVLPSIVSPSGDTEGLGVVLLEAMAAGAPVVASRVGGIVDAVEHERTGLLVEPEKPDALALAVIRVVSDASLADRLTAAGRQSIEERFSWNRIAERFDELFHRVAGV